VNLNTPDVLIDWIRDVYTVKLPEPCFDQFSIRSRPRMNVSGNDLILIIPGRCATFAKIHLPPVGTPFSGAEADIFDPTNFIKEYVSSAVYDFNHQYIFYALKTYQTSSTILHSVDISVVPMQPSPLSVDLNLEESETVLTLGTETINSREYTYLFVIASGSNKILRLLFDGAQYISNATAVLDSTINQISSSSYYKPWLYFSTYEPDAKIVRIADNNFCETWCQDVGYCKGGLCYCRPGYQVDHLHPSFGCRPTPIVEAEEAENSSEKASLALGILFGITVVVAIAGWTSWWRVKAKKSATYTSLVGDKGL